MKRKRFVKLMMANGHDRNSANKLADMYKGERRGRLIANYKLFDELAERLCKPQQTLERIVQLVE